MSEKNQPDQPQVYAGAKQNKDGSLDLSKALRFKEPLPLGTNLEKYQGTAGILKLTIETKMEQLRESIQQSNENSKSDLRSQLKKLVRMSLVLDFHLGFLPHQLKAPDPGYYVTPMQKAHEETIYRDQVLTATTLADAKNILYKARKEYRKKARSGADPLLIRNIVAIDQLVVLIKKLENN